MLPATVIPSSLSTCPNRRLASRIDQRAGCRTPSRSTPSRAPLRPTTSPTLRVPVTARQPRGRRSSHSCSPPSSPSASSTFTFLKNELLQYLCPEGGRPRPVVRRRSGTSPSAVTGPSRMAPPPRSPSLTPASRAPACRGRRRAAYQLNPRPRRRRPTGRTTCVSACQSRRDTRVLCEPKQKRRFVGFILKASRARGVTPGSEPGMPSGALSYPQESSLSSSAPQNT